MQILEDADEKLTGLLIALAIEYNASPEEYTNEEIEGFYKVKDELIKHPETGYTVEKAHDLIRNKPGMKFELFISPTTLSETDDAHVYYEKSSVGLGDRFLKSLEDIYKKLSRTPKYYGFVTNGKDLRDVKFKNFPFVVIFQIVNDKFFVLRVFNTNSNPNLLKSL